MTNGKPLALVTGASSGIGYELAKQFAENGFDVLICAEDAAIEAAAQSLDAAASGGSRVWAIQADLTTEDGVEAVVTEAWSDGRLEAIALNAGVGNAGPFVQSSLEDDLRLIELNIMAPVYLAKQLLPKLVKQGSGKVLFTSSVAATMPGPYYATYAASKAFIQSFAQALRYELKDSGVSVTALQPGPTDTEFFERAGMQNTTAGQSSKDDPAEVAKQGFEALMAGKDSVVAGSAINKVQTAAAALLPETTRAAAHARQTQPKD